MASYKSFEELPCWQACLKVRRWIMQVAKRFPKNEKFDLVDNMKRASRSATRNIAEGFGRFHYGENIQFCRHSRGSLFELIDDLITAQDEGYISQQEFQVGKDLIQHAIHPTNGYIKYLKNCQNRNN